MVRDVARRRHQIGAEDDVDLIRERAGNALDDTRSSGDVSITTTRSPGRLTHDRYANACSVRASTSVPAAASSAEVNSSGL